jgi:hypothetical protein
MHSIIAAASSSGVALGINSFASVFSEKIGRTSKVQPGQIAGASKAEPRQKLSSAISKLAQGVLW